MWRGIWRTVRALGGILLTVSSAASLLGYPSNYQAWLKLIAPVVMPLSIRPSAYVLLVLGGLLLLSAIPWRGFKTRRSLAHDLGLLVLQGRKRYVEWVAGEDVEEAVTAWMTTVCRLLNRYVGAFAEADFKTPRMREGERLGVLSPREEHGYRVERLNDTVIPKILDGRYKRRL